MSYASGVLAGLTQGNSFAIDVGASPGGWTQKLAHMGYERVLAVDPGHLEDAVKQGGGRIVHLPHVVQSKEVREAIQEAKDKDKLRLRMLVCDVNFEPQEAARVLAKHCLPHLEGIDKPSSTVPSFVI